MNALQQALLAAGHVSKEDVDRVNTERVFEEERLETKKKQERTRLVTRVKKEILLAGHKHGIDVIPDTILEEVADLAVDHPDRYRHLLQSIESGSGVQDCLNYLSVLQRDAVW